METSCRTLPSVHHCTVVPPTPYGGTGALRCPRESEGAVNSLKSAACGLTPAKREANSSL